MNRRLIVLTGTFALIALLVVGCAGAAAPTAAPVPAASNAASSSAAANNPAAQSSSSGGAFESKSNEGGSVTVVVKPTALAVGETVAFDVAMDTHSVELSDDMTKIAILRDDAGKEYKATAWDGPGGGGHHREGIIKFAALTSKPHHVELVIKGLAKVPERVFQWDMP
ncbi:MAG: hypothetical protein HY782_03040 [Chloroflexi bacterium]|nr:hypothetical protein [Chloroflexota bacterium]